ncbi:MAG: L-threonylcarbamoyladenylate synthase [Verrucomicrobiota bacterium]|jgi:L-threonylcarbamoyladenylate synthase
MKTVVLQTHTAALFEEAVRQAAVLLRAGQLVALPTETVYGLAANAWDAVAVARIYEMKGRPAGNPIIVHVDGLELARRCVASWPPEAEKLAKAFWPGPLTLVLPRSAQIPGIVTAGGPTVGVRWPAHPLIQAVVGACGFPLAAPSANPASRVSSTNAEHVRKYFGGKIPLIVDGGQAQVGIESSVVDLSAAPARLLRPGMVDAESLLAALGEGELRVAAPDWSGGTETMARSPGLLPKHYSPKAKLVVLSWRDEADLDLQVKALRFPPERICLVAHSRIPLSGGFGRVAVLPREAEGFARALYSELHQCDEAGAGLIVVEAAPPVEEWRAIADRLSRAARKEG